MAAGVLLLGMAAGSQVTAALGQTVPEEPKSVEMVPRVPGLTTLFSGLNVGVSYAAVHNSSIGWYTVLTPALSFTFSPHYSVDASASLYLDRAGANDNPATSSTEPLVKRNFSAGDSVIGFHATFLPKSLLNTTSAYLTVPTGDRSAGLGVGKVSFDFANHTERYVKNFGLLLDLGLGNSSNVFNNQVSRNYSSSGALASFQSGAVVRLPKRSYFEPLAYEQLPVGSQTVYSSVAPGAVPAQPVATGVTFAEDNGFIVFAAVPLNEHFALSGYYNRSLRRRTDTVSFGITWVLHNSSREKRVPLIDRALQEAEKAVP